MSTKRKPSEESAGPSAGDRAIANYLKAHPDYFERNPGLLTHLRLPHDVGANAVSLIERQVAILREKNRKLDQKLRELVGLARANDVLSGKIHEFGLRLIGVANVTEVLDVIENTLRDDFGAERAVLVLFAEAGEDGDLFDGTFVRRIARDDPGLDLFRSFLATSRPRCGQVKGTKREFLFGRDGADVQSAALIPLGPKAATGFVAIGSRDTSRFHPGMSTDFLARIAELVERGLATAA